MQAHRWILSSIIVLTPSLLAAQESATEPPGLTVNGSAELQVEPDEAVVEVGVDAESPTADAAQAEASRIAAEILSGLRGLEIDETAVQTSQLMLNPVYDYRRGADDGPPRVIAYRASNVVSVRLHDLTKIGPVIDAATRAGANRVQGVQFRLRNDLEARQEALRQATAEARAKAKVIASALGVELGPVLDVEEGGVTLQPVRVGQMQMMRAEAKASFDTPVSAGEITISATVRVRYRLGGP